MRHPSANFPYTIKMTQRFYKPACQQFIKYTSMKYALLAFIFCSVILSSCSTKNCDCVEPPRTWKIYKMTDRTGGVAGTSVSLTDEQKNSVLSISSYGEFSCKNTVTGVEVSGLYTLSTINSLYGEKPRIIFSPNLPILNNDFHIILNSTNTLLVLGDNVSDGYSTTFTVTP